MDAPLTPLVTKVKSVASTPVTLLLNVTVKPTALALDGSALALTIDETAGSASPTAKSLKEVKPLPVVVVALAELLAGAVHVLGALNFLTRKLVGVAPTS